MYNKLGECHPIPPPTYLITVQVKEKCAENVAIKKVAPHCPPTFLVY